MATYSKLGERLKLYRINSLLTQQQVADALNINRTTYTYYEIGKTEPSIETLFKLVKIFGITYEDLLPGMDEAVLNDSATRINGREAIYNLSKDEQQAVLFMRTMSEEQRKNFVDEMKKMSK